MAASASLLLSLAAYVLLCLFTTLSSANDSNVLLTGDVLGPDSQLSCAGATFVMQGDCNLVLYNGRSGFQSDTHGDGANCTLALSDRGRFVVSRSDGHAVWNSTLREETERGKYAAVLRPDGEVSVYGPALWSTPDFRFPRAAAAEMAAATPLATKNVLFSSQKLGENGGQLETRDYTLAVKQRCDLELVKASGSVGVVWRTGTVGKGRRCFLQLDRRGQLALVSDHARRKTTLWSSKNASAEGEYVLLLQINGQAVVYGPEVWSTSPSPS